MITQTPGYPDLPRLTDREALAALTHAARKLIRTHAYTRCLAHPNKWHNPIGRTEPCGRKCVKAESAV